MRRPTRAALLCAAALAGGCAWQRPKADPTEFFVLQARPDAPRATGRRAVVELADIDVPAYLQNPRMAVRSGETEVSFDEFKRWAEPLSRGVARVITEDLAGVADVRPAPVANPAPDLRLTVRLSSFEGRLDAGGAGSILVAASWELKNREGSLKRGRFTASPAAWDGKDYSRLAALQSDALSALCEELRRALVTGG